MASLTELQTFCQSLQEQISKLEVLVSLQANTICQHALKIQSLLDGPLESDMPNVGWGNHLAPFNDPIFEGTPKTLEVTQESQESPRNPPVLLKSPKDIPKDTEIPKEIIEIPKDTDIPKEIIEIPKDIPKDIIEIPKDTLDIPKEQPENNLYPLESSTLSIKSLSKNKDFKTLSQVPFDPLRCRRRMNYRGFACQCMKPVHENGLCKSDFNSLYGDKQKPVWAQTSSFPHGYFDDPRPSQDCITGAKISWKSPTSSIDSKSLPELRNLVSRKFPQMNQNTLKKTKKSNLISLLESPVEEAIPPHEAVPPIKVQPVLENNLSVDPPLDDPDGDLQEDDTIYYDDVSFEGVDYLVKASTLFSTNYEEIGNWDTTNLIATFSIKDALISHNENRILDD